MRHGGRPIRRSPGWVWRFRCPECRRTFSSSIFGLDYRRRIAGLAPKVYAHITEGQAERQVARSLGVSRGAVGSRRRQLARQALLVQVELQRRFGRTVLAGDRAHPFELDGFRTFAMSQFEPLDLHTLVHADTGLVFDIDPAPLRRMGRMTAHQKDARREREARLGRPPRRARRRSAAATLARLAEVASAPLAVRLATDQEPAYRAAIEDAGRGGRMTITHRTISSRARRDDPDHPLWQTNHLHRLLRHARADHKRETLSFSKRLLGLMERAWITVVWRNLTKGVSERTLKKRRVTPAMLAGLAARPLSGAELFARRRFPSIVGLPERYRPVYQARLKARPREILAAA